MPRHALHVLQARLPLLAPANAQCVLQGNFSMRAGLLLPVSIARQECTPQLVRPLAVFVPQAPTQKVVRRNASTVLPEQKAFRVETAVRPVRSENILPLVHPFALCVHRVPLLGMKVLPAVMLAALASIRISLSPRAVRNAPATSYL